MNVVNGYISYSEITTAAAAESTFPAPQLFHVAAADACCQDDTCSSPPGCQPERFHDSVSAHAGPYFHRFHKN